MSLRIGIGTNLRIQPSGFSLEAPSGLTAITISDTRIDLACTSNSAGQEDGFYWERSPDGIASWVVIGTTLTGVVAYSDTICVADTLYYYRVRAYRKITYSEYSNIDSDTTYITQAQDLFDRMTIYPPYLLRNLINTTIKNYKANGEWVESDAIWHTNLHTEQASCLNWKGNDAYNLVPVGLPVWEYGVGYTIANGKYLRTGFVPSVDGVKYILNSAGLCIGVVNDLAVNGTDIGACSVGDTKISDIITRGWGSALIAINQGSRQVIANGDSSGYWCSKRTAANLVTLYKNGVSIGSIATGSTALTEKELYIGANDNNGVAGGFTIGRKYNCAKITSGVIDHAKDALDTKYFNDNVGAAIEYWDTQESNINFKTIGAASLLTLVTPDGFGAVVQPQVLDLGAEWYGYRYWMTDTPFHNNDTSLEKVCIWGSNDGVTWDVPATITNPVVNIEESADPELFFEGGILYCVYCVAAGEPFAGCLSMIHTSDGGTNWSAQVIVWTPSVGDEKATSPAIIKIGSYYYIYYVKEVTTDQNLRRVRSSTIEGTYTNYEVISMLPIGGDYDHIYYHIDIIAIEEVFWLASSIKNGAPGTVGMVGRSVDGINFIRNPDTTYSLGSNLGQIYRPALCHIGSDLYCYYSGWHIPPNDNNYARFKVTNRPKKYY